MYTNMTEIPFINNKPALHDLSKTAHKKNYSHLPAKVADIFLSHLTFISLIQDWKKCPPYPLISLTITIVHSPHASCFALHFLFHAFLIA